MGQAVYTFTEQDIIDALEANGWFLSYGDEWVHEKQTYIDRGGLSLREAFEALLRKSNIKG